MVLKNATEIWTKTVAMTVDYLERAIPAVEILAGEFYRGAVPETWDRFGDLLNGLQWLLKITEFRPTDGVDAFQNFLLRIKPKISGLEEALKNSDQILLADLLCYDILPLLKTLEFDLKNSYPRYEAGYVF